MEFTKKEINAARKIRPVRRTIIDNIESYDLLTGDLITLEKRIKDYIKKQPIWKTFRWEDGSGLKISELKICVESPTWESGYEVHVFAEKMIPEPDERVIRKLKEKIKRKQREKKKKDANKKRELTLLKKLKEKYEQ